MNTLSMRRSLIIASAMLMVAQPCFADNLGAIGDALALLIIGSVIVFGLMTLFIVLGRMMKVGALPTNGAGAGGLVRVTRLAVAIWYVISATPIIHNVMTSNFFGHDLGWVILFSFIGGLPAHIASIFALVRASNFAKSNRKTDPV
jgi:hypothetical protein